MPLKQFLYGCAMAIMVIGALLAYGGYRNAENLAASAFALFVFLIPTAIVAIAYFSLARILENQERLAISQRRIEENLNKLTKDIE
jgi:Mg2+/citrate symporter